MDREELIVFKDKLIDFLINEQEDKLSLLTKAQNERLNDANAEDSDKGNLMDSPLESEMEEVNLNAFNIDTVAKNIEILKKAEQEGVKENVVFGSLVRTNTTFFLIAFPFSEIEYGGHRIRGISTEAPLFEKMEGFAQHTEFHLNNIEYVIFEIV